MIQLEKDIEAKLVERVRNSGGFCLKWTSPGWAGVPDRIVLLPGARVIFVETKRPKGGVLSGRQTWWRAKLQEFGFVHYVIWNRRDLDQFCAEVL
jgi:hypothetical protein